MTTVTNWCLFTAITQSHISEVSCLEKDEPCSAQLLFVCVLSCFWSKATNSCMSEKHETKLTANIGEGWWALNNMLSSSVEKGYIIWSCAEKDSKSVSKATWKRTLNGLQKGQGRLSQSRRGGISCRQNWKESGNYQNMKIQEEILDNAQESFCTADRGSIGSAGETGGFTININTKHMLYCKKKIVAFNLSVALLQNFPLMECAAGLAVKELRRLKSSGFK